MPSSTCKNGGSVSFANVCIQAVPGELKEKGEGKVMAIDVSV